MTIIFFDIKQVNGTDENTADEYYSVEIVKMVGANGPGYRFVATTIQQIPQGSNEVKNEYLIPAFIDNSSPAFFINALNLAAYKLTAGVTVTEHEARRFAYKWLEAQ